MGQGFGCLLIEARPDRLAELAGWIAGLGGHVERRLAGFELGLGEAPRIDPSLVVVDLADHEAFAACRRLAARRRELAFALVVLVRAEEGDWLARAASLGVDDIVLLPDTREALAAQLELAAALGAYRREHVLRRRVAATFAEGAPPPASRLTAPRFRVCLVGTPGRPHMALLDILNRTTIAYASEAELPELLHRREGFDLLLRCETGLPRSRFDSAPPARFVALAQDSDLGLDVGEALARLPLPMPKELLRTRIASLLEMARLRRELRASQDGIPGIVDGPTGLLNKAFLLAYAHQLTRERHERRFLLALELRTLPAINRGQGYPAGNQALRGLARALARELRAGDLLAALGEGRYALLPQGPVDERASQRLARRLAGLWVGLTAVAVPWWQDELPELALQRACHRLEGAQPARAA